MMLHIKKYIDSRIVTVTRISWNFISSLPSLYYKLWTDQILQEIVVAKSATFEVKRYSAAVGKKINVLKCIIDK